MLLPYSIFNSFEIPKYQANILEIFEIFQGYCQAQIMFVKSNKTELARIDYVYYNFARVCKVLEDSSISSKIL